jgi:hypothetical protein
MREKGVRPDREMGAIEITNLLKSPEWGGVRGEGQHDLAIFTDVLYYLEAQMLSALKHFAPHIKTISLTRGHQPNADQSLPNLGLWICCLSERLDTCAQSVLSNVRSVVAVCGHAGKSMGSQRYASLRRRFLCCVFTVCQIR